DARSDLADTQPEIPMPLAETRAALQPPPSLLDAMPTLVDKKEPPPSLVDAVPTVPDRKPVPPSLIDAVPTVPARPSARLGSRPAAVEAGSPVEAKPASSE